MVEGFSLARVFAVPAPRQTGLLLTLSLSLSLSLSLCPFFRSANRYNKLHFHGAAGLIQQDAQKRSEERAAAAVEAAAAAAATAAAPTDTISS